MKSTSSSFWLLLVTFGNLMVVVVEVIAEPFHLTKSENMYTYAVIGAASNVVLIILCLKFKGKPQIN